MKRVTRVEAKGKRGEVIRVIIYCRVSTDDQEDNGTSLDTQALECRLWAEQQGYFVVDVVRETYSGASLEERKLFMEVMGRCKNGEADAIVFRTYDRLTRSVAHLYVILSEANRHGFELLCVKETFDPKNILEVILRTLVIQ